MLNYESPAGLLDPLVPAGVELDRWRETLYVSVVGFLFRDTRVLGLAIPFHRTFEEVNLRFYVRRESNGEMRRGEGRSRERRRRRAIATVARLLYNEPYRALPMRHRITRGADGVIEREYAWRTSRAWTSIESRTEGTPQPLAADSEEEFITEHYWGYTRQRDGGTLEYQVEHPHWRIWHANESWFSGDARRLYGPAFADVLSRPARPTFVALGSEVVVHHGRRLAIPA
jgi:uncharacterized protein YqjF (DUF2071 family)